MRVKIRFFTTLREITGKREDTADLADGMTVGDLLSFLSTRYGRELADYLYEENTRLHNYLQILVNGNSITALQDLKTELKDGDTLAIVPPVAGG